MGVKRFGDWDKVKARLANNPGARLTLAIRQATIKNALLLVREIKRGIVKQAPGGVPFVELAESTIERKGSSKALIDTGLPGLRRACHARETHPGSHIHF